MTPFRVTVLLVTFVALELLPSSNSLNVIKRNAGEEPVRRISQGSDEDYPIQVPYERFTPAPTTRAPTTVKVEEPSKHIEPLPEQLTIESGDNETEYHDMEKSPLVLYLPDDPPAYVAPKSQQTDVVPVAQLVEVRPESELAQSQPADNVPESQEADIVPESQPADNVQSDVVPETQPADVVPETRPAIVVPESQPAVIEPESQIVLVIPESQLVDEVEESQPFDVVPESLPVDVNNLDQMSYVVSPESNVGNGTDDRNNSSGDSQENIKNSYILLNNPLEGNRERARPTFGNVEGAIPCQSCFWKYYVPREQAIDNPITKIVYGPNSVSWKSYGEQDQGIDSLSNKFIFGPESGIDYFLTSGENINTNLYDSLRPRYVVKTRPTSLAAQNRPDLIRYKFTQGSYELNNKNGGFGGFGGRSTMTDSERLDALLKFLKGFGKHLGREY